VPQASAYVVRFFRDGRKVFEQRIGSPKLTLPSSFHFTAGHYRWEVRPVVGSRVGAPVVASQFVVSAAAAKP
jgi:hypothetical protein